MMHIALGDVRLGTNATYDNETLVSIIKIRLKSEMLNYFGESNLKIGRILLFDCQLKNTRQSVIDFN